MRRGQSGARLPAIDQTACATTATAASLRPWTQPAPDRSVVAATSPNSVRATADGSVKPSHAAMPPSHAGASRADRDADLAAGRSGQHLGQRHHVAEGRLVQPAAARHVLPAEVAEVGHRPPERGQAEPQRPRRRPRAAGRPATRLLALSCVHGGGSIDSGSDAARGRSARPPAGSRPSRASSPACPPTSGAAIVIAQHLDPRRPSHLGEILARHATLPIKVVADGDRLEDGVIFVVPSNRLVEIVDDDVRLRPMPAKPGTIAPSVDLLLETAAAAFGQRATAVILTGTGSDGSAGAWHVKQAGGTVVIENPATAMFPSMPRSISPSLVDATAGPRGDRRRAVRLVDACWSDRRRPRPPTDREALRASRPCSTGSGAQRHRLQHLQAGHHHPPAAWPDGRDRAHALADYASAARARPGGVRAAHQQPPDQGHRVLPRPEGLRAPASTRSCRPSSRTPAATDGNCGSGRPAARPARRPIRSRSPRRRPSRSDGPVDVRVFATDIDRDAIAFARRGIYPPGGPARTSRPRSAAGTSPSPTAATRSSGSSARG